MRLTGAAILVFRASTSLQAALAPELAFDRGQQLEHHPHVHAVAPGGGLSADGQRRLACRPNFLLPVKVLGQVFRGKFFEGLRQAYVTGRL